MFCTLYIFNSFSVIFYFSLFVFSTEISFIFGCFTDAISTFNRISCSYSSRLKLSPDTLSWLNCGKRLSHSVVTSRTNSALYFILTKSDSFAIVTWRSKKSREVCATHCNKDGRFLWYLHKSSQNSWIGTWRLLLSNHSQFFSFLYETDCITNFPTAELSTVTSTTSPNSHASFIAQLVRTFQFFQTMFCKLEQKKFWKVLSSFRYRWSRTNYVCYSFQSTKSMHLNFSKYQWKIFNECNVYIVLRKT